MRAAREPYTSIPLPSLQRQMVDWLELMSRRHMIHALIELDVTDTRRAIRAARGAAGAPLSLTAYVIACLARAIGEHKRMHAYRRGRRRYGSGHANRVLNHCLDVPVLHGRRTREPARAPRNP